jgi:hypothetical protein
VTPRRSPEGASPVYSGRTQRRLPPEVSADPPAAPRQPPATTRPRGLRPRIGHPRTTLGEGNADPLRGPRRGSPPDPLRGPMRPLDDSANTLLRGLADHPDSLRPITSPEPARSPQHARPAPAREGLRVTRGTTARAPPPPSKRPSQTASTPLHHHPPRTPHTTSSPSTTTPRRGPPKTSRRGLRPPPRRSRRRLALCLDGGRENPPQAPRLPSAGSSRIGDRPTGTPRDRPFADPPMPPPGRPTDVLRDGLGRRGRDVAKPSGGRARARDRV